MYIESVPNRNSPPAVLLRESYRKDGKICKRTIANLSKLDPQIVEGLKALLKGAVVTSPTQDPIKIVRSLPHGHVAVILGILQQIGLDRLLNASHGRLQKIALALIVQRLIEPSSKLSSARAFNPQTMTSSLSDCLNLGEVKHYEIYDALDWLLNEQPRIEKALAKRHLENGMLILYDVSSSYVEGTKCNLAAFGYNRDRKRGKQQIIYGLLCNQEGCPIAIEVFPGNHADRTTLTEQVNKLKERFNLKHVILTGDRGTITAKNIENLLNPAGLDWISALKASAIRQILEQVPLPFEKRNEYELAEISSPDYHHERLILCYNPFLAKERGRKREALIEATEKLLEDICDACNRPKKPLRGRDKIGVEVGKVLDKYKVGKHFEISMTDTSFSFKRNTLKLNEEAALDGLYIIRTSVNPDVLSNNNTVKAYKSLAQVELAFRTLKSSDLCIRPIYHWLDDRVRAHIFLCMLAYYVEWHLRQQLAPYLFADDEKQEVEMSVAPRELSESAKLKKGSKVTKAGRPVNSYQTLMKDLATLTLNKAASHENEASTFDMYTQPTPFQQEIFDHLKINPTRQRTQ